MTVSLKDTLPVGDNFPHKMGEPYPGDLAQATPNPTATPAANSSSGASWVSQVIARREARNSSALARYQMALRAVHSAKAKVTDHQLEELGAAATAAGITDSMLQEHQSLLERADQAAQEAHSHKDDLQKYQAAGQAVRDYELQVYGPAAQKINELAAERDRLGNVHSMHADSQGKADGLARQVAELLGTAS